MWVILDRDQSAKCRIQILCREVQEARFPPSISQDELAYRAVAEEELFERFGREVPDECIEEGTVGNHEYSVFLDEVHDIEEGGFRSFKKCLVGFESWDVSIASWKPCREFLWKKSRSLSVVPFVESFDDQWRTEANCRGKNFRSLASSAQVTAHNLFNTEYRDCLCQFLGLRDPCCIEGNVFGALAPAGKIPVGLAVPDKEYLSHRRTLAE